MKKILFLTFFLGIGKCFAASYTYIPSTTTFHNYKINVGSITTRNLDASTFTVTNLTASSGTITNFNTTSGAALFGNATSLGWTFQGDRDTGIFDDPVGNDMVFVTGGVARVEITNNFEHIYKPTLHSGGSITSPEMSFESSTVIGLRYISTNTFAATSGSIDVAFFSSTGTSIMGTTLGTNAKTGFVGEYISSSCVSASSGANIWSDAVSVTLTAGDWDLDFNANASSTSISLVTWREITTAITTTAGNSGTGVIVGDNASDIHNPAASGGFTFDSISLPVNSLRKLITTTTTFYGKTFNVTAAGAPTISARLSARRRQ